MELEERAEEEKEEEGEEGRRLRCFEFLSAGLKPADVDKHAAVDEVTVSESFSSAAAPNDVATACCASNASHATAPEFTTLARIYPIAHFSNDGTLTATAAAAGNHSGCIANATATPRLIIVRDSALAAFRRSPERAHRMTASALRKATISSAQAAVFVARQQRRTERKEARLASLRDARDAKIKARATPQLVARTRRVNKTTPAAARARSSQTKTQPSSRRSAATSSTGTAMSASRTPRSSAVHRPHLGGARSRRSAESTPPLSRHYSPKASPTSPSESPLLQAFALGCNPTRLTPPEWRPVGSASSHAESSGACPRLDRLDAELLVLSMRLGINGPDPLEFVDSEEEEGTFGLVAPHSTSSFLPRDSSAGRNIAEYPASVPLEGKGTTTSARHYFDDGSLVDLPRISALEGAHRGLCYRHV